MKTHLDYWKNRFFYVVLCIGLLLIIVSAVNPYDDANFGNEEHYAFSEGWTNVKENGEEVPVELTNKVDSESDYTIVLKKVLPDNLEGMTALLMRTSQQTLKVYIDNQLIYAYGDSSKDTILGITYGSCWNIIRLPDHSEGKTITMEITAGYKAYAGTTYNVYTGTESALIFKVFHEHILDIVISFLILLIGFELLVMQFWFSKQLGGERNLQNAGWFAVIVGIWMMCESKMPQFFLGNLFFMSTLTMVSFLLFPVALMQYVVGVRNFKLKKMFKSWIWFELIYAMVAFILQGLDVVDLIGGMNISMLVNMTTGVFVLIVSCLEVFIYKNKEMRHVFIAISGISLFSLADAIRFYSSDMKLTGYFSKIGFLVFIIIIAEHTIKSAILMIERGKRADYYQNLATIDFMTNCKNRTAYINDLEYVENNKDITNSTIIMIADINNLKQINDIYGHHMGDEAIIRCAELLENHFGIYGGCYRLGGDEFAGIFCNTNHGEIQKVIENILQRLVEVNKELNYELDLAIGIATYDKKQDISIHSTVRRADRQMYKRKVEMKRMVKA